MFENKVLRNLFGVKREKLQENGKFHNAVLHAFYASPNIIWNINSRLLRWVEHATRMELSRNAYSVLAGRPEGKRPLEWPRRS